MRWRDVLVVDDREFLWALIAYIGEEGVWCDSVDRILVGGTAVKVTPHGFLVEHRSFQFGGGIGSYPDPKGCFRNDCVVTYEDPEPDAFAVGPQSIEIDAADRTAIEALFPSIEGPPDNPKERTIEVLAKRRTNRGSVYVVFVSWALTAMLSPRGGADVFWVTGEGDVLGSLAFAERDAILDVSVGSIRVKGREDAVRFRHGVLESSTRYLDKSGGDGPFAHD